MEIELGNELNKLLEQSVSVGATPTVAALVSRVMDFLNKRSHVANTVRMLTSTDMHVLSPVTSAVVGCSEGVSKQNIILSANSCKC